MNELKTKLIPSDFEGSISCPMDCTGARALDRCRIRYNAEAALHNSNRSFLDKILFRNKLQFIDSGVLWGSRAGHLQNGSYMSYNEKGEVVSLPYVSKVGDWVTFKLRKQ